MNCLSGPSQSEGVLPAAVTAEVGAASRGRKGWGDIALFLSPFTLCEGPCGMGHGR